MDKVIPAILAIIILFGAVALLFLWQPEGPPEIRENETWGDFLEKKGMLMEGASSISISSPENVTNNVILLEINETFISQENVSFVRTSFVFIDLNTSEAKTAAYYITTQNSEEEREEILDEMLG